MTTTTQPTASRGAARPAPRPPRRAALAAALTAALAPGLAAAAATATWNGSADALWATGTNWDTGAAPTAADTASFPNITPASGTTATLAAGTVAAGLDFAKIWTLTGGGLTLGSGVVNVAPSVTAFINTPWPEAPGSPRPGRGRCNWAGPTPIRAARPSAPEPCIIR